MAGAVTGHGATIGSTLWTAWDSAPPLLTSIGGISHTREALETTHLGTAAAGTPAYAYGTFVPGDIVRGNEIAIEGFFQPELGPPPIGGASETWTITYANTEASTYAFPGFLVGVEVDPASTDQLMRFTATLKIAGAVTWSA
jgi:hypothetical protein